MMPGSTVTTPVVTPVKNKRAKASKKTSSTNIDLTNESVLSSSLSSSSSHDTNNNTASYLNYNVQNVNGAVVRVGLGMNGEIIFYE